MRSFFGALVVSAFSVGCAMGSAAEPSTSSEAPLAALDSLTHLERKPDAPPLRAPLKLLETDACDESSFDLSTWREKTEGNLIFRYIPGTAAERDLGEIAQTRQRMYEEIAKYFGVATPGPVKVVLSPNRAAAVKHGYGLGSTIVANSTAEVIYTGDEHSFEKRSPGHELAHIIGSKVDGAFHHMPFLDEGMAELLDGSGRDLHAAYVNEVRARSLSGSATRLTSEDVHGASTARAGSFVKFLADRYGRDRLLNLWKAAAITWSGSTFTTTGSVKVTTARDLEVALDRALLSTHDAGFETVRREWEAALSPYFLNPTSVDADDAAQIKAIVANADLAINRGDAHGLRSTMEGFYCDLHTDTDRFATAVAAVASGGGVRTDVVSILPNNHRNYPEVVVHAVRTETRHGVETKTAQQIWLERLPVGWRITSASW
jgi:hypothetical protein